MLWFASGNRLQQLAYFFTNLLYFLRNMKFVCTSSSVRWKEFLYSPWKSTLSILCGLVAGSSQEFTTSLWPQQPSWRRQGWVGWVVYLCFSMIWDFCVWPGMVLNQRQLSIVVPDWEPYLGSLFSPLSLWDSVFYIIAITIYMIKYDLMLVVWGVCICALEHHYEIKQLLATCLFVCVTRTE